MIGYGVASTAFAGLAITMVDPPRERRAQAHPRDAAAARDVSRSPCLLSTFVVFLIEAALIIAIGRLLFDVAVPERLALAARCCSCSARSASRRWGSA